MRAIIELAYVLVLLAAFVALVRVIIGNKKKK